VLGLQRDSVDFEANTLIIKHTVVKQKSLVTKDKTKNAASCASLLIAQGFSLKDVQEWLGHADITLTANTYSHLDIARKKSIAESIVGSFLEAR